VDRDDQLSAVTVGEHRIAELAAEGDDACVPRENWGIGSSAALEQLVGDGGQQRLLVREVVVERARLEAELRGDAPHRQIREPVHVEDVDRALDDVGTVEPHDALTPCSTQRAVQPFGTTCTTIRRRHSMQNRGGSIRRNSSHRA